MGKTATSKYVLILIIVFTFGCTDIINNIGSKNCGADFKCFEAAIQACEPAQLNFEINVFLSASVHHTIIKNTEQGCEIYSKMTNPATGGTLTEQTCWVKDYANSSLDSFGIKIKNCNQ